MSDSSSPGALRLLLALGYGAGAVLLLLLLTKDDAEALTARVGYTALSMILLGLVAAAGARLLDRSELASLWGWATLLVAAVTFILIMVEIWPEDLLYPNETRTLVMVVISLLFGGGSLVLSGEGDEPDQATRIASRVALVALVAFGVLTVLLASGVEVGERWFGIASAVFLIAALSLPVLRLAAARDDAF